MKAMTNEMTVKSYVVRSFEELERMIGALRSTRGVAAVSTISRFKPLNVCGTEENIEKFERAMDSGEFWDYIDDNGVYVQ